MAAGHRTAAIALLEQSVRQGLRLLDTPFNPTVHTDPEFVGIERDSSYQEMLRGLAAAATRPVGLTAH
jgi:hypothetical protein